MTNLFEKYYLQSFVTHMNRSNITFGLDKTFQNIATFISDLFFAVTKTIYMLFDFILWIAERFNILLSYSDGAFGTATSLYNTLFNLLSVPILLVSVLYYIYVYATSSTKKANRFAITFLCILSVNVLFYNQGGEIVKQTNKFFTQIETSLTTIAVDPAKQKDVESEQQQAQASTQANNSDDNTKVGEVMTTASNDNSITLLRDYLFQSLIADTFMSLNWGELTFDENKAKDYLVSSDVKDDDFTNSLKSIYDKVNGDNSVLYFQDVMAVDKIMISFTSIFKAVLIGIILVGLALFRMVLQLLLLLMIYLLPIVSIIAFVPKYNMVLFRYITQALSVFAFMPFLSLGMLILFYMFNVIDKTVTDLLKGVSVANIPSVILLTTLIKFVFVAIVWKSRTKIMQILTSGSVVDVAKQGAMNMYDTARMGMSALRGNVNDLYEKRTVESETAQATIESEVDEVPQGTVETWQYENDVDYNNVPMDKVRDDIIVNNDMYFDPNIDVDNQFDLDNDVDFDLPTIDNQVEIDNPIHVENDVDVSTNENVNVTMYEDINSDEF